MQTLRSIAALGVLCVVGLAGCANPWFEVVTSGSMEDVDVERIKASGADINGWNDDECTPLHESVLLNNTAAIHFLLDNGADINAVDDDDETPLHYAADDGMDESAKVLIERGANIDARDEDDATPLMYAAGNGGYKICEMLIEAGADLEAVDDDGENPLRYAKDDHNTLIVRLLRKHGAGVAPKGVRPVELTSELPSSSRSQLGSLSDNETLVLFYRKETSPDSALPFVIYANNKRIVDLSRGGYFAYKTKPRTLIIRTHIRYEAGDAIASSMGSGLGAGLVGGPIVGGAAAAGALIGSSVVAKAETTRTVIAEPGKVHFVDLTPNNSFWRGSNRPRMRLIPASTGIQDIQSCESVPEYKKK